MPLTMVRDDITAMEVDAIVNAANCDLKQGGGVCGAIFHAAGEEPLSAACDAIGFCPTGQAVVTPGFHSRAKWIIHTPGPIWSDGSEAERAQLSACYTNALALAAQKGCRSIAFPLISSGIYGCPKEEALSVAVSAIRAYLLGNDDIDVYLTLFDSGSSLLGDNLFKSLLRYILKNSIETYDDMPRERRSKPRVEPLAVSMPSNEDGAAPMGVGLPEYLIIDDNCFAETQASICPPAPMREELSERKKHPDADADASPVPCRPAMHFDMPMYARRKNPAQESTDADVSPYIRRLKDVIKSPEESFSVHVLKLIDARGKTDVEIYRNANIGRQLFSKIRCDPMYQPSKRTAIALALALKLNLDETTDLLQKAGFALSRCSKFDIIVQYFIENGVYDVFEINEALFAFGQNLLGA